MVSALAASALKRRFLLGPMIALALAGVGLAASPPDQAAPLPAGTASPSPSDDVAAVKRALTLAHEAEAVYYVDNMEYLAAAGDELVQLREIERRIAWGTQVVVQLPAEVGEGSEVVILRALLPSGGSLCIAEVSEVEDAGTYYARAPAGAKCPTRKDGMPGWTMDPVVGWGP